MKRSAVAIGTFDGIHCGHRYLLDRLVRLARSEKLDAVVVTLERPVRPVNGLLTTADEKVQLLRRLPVDRIAVLPVTTEIIDQPAMRFFEEYIVGKLGARRLVVGKDFAFGYGREGDTRWLRRVGPRKGVVVTIVPPLRREHGIVSSSRIRALVEAGDIDAANRLLGRPYSLEGFPVSGRSVGRQIGFPTINLSPDAGKLLPTGVFAALVEGDRSLLPGVMNIGTRPTFFETGPVAIEINLLEFRGAWKHGRTKVHICHRLRDEMRFPDVAALQRQLAQDVRDGAAYFGR
jgi:riboflavin kinase/FMN adenylyltransferase